MSKDQVINEPLMGNYQQPPPPPMYNPQYNQQYVNPQPNQPFPQVYQNNYPGYPQNNMIGQPYNPAFQPPPFGFPVQKSPCPFCRKQTDSFPKKVAGGVAWMWCFGLFIFTGVFWCIPFCVDGCQDTQVTCAICQGVKTTIEPSTCC